MSQSILIARPPGQPDLKEVLSQNRLTYDRLAGEYGRSGPARLVQAQRWLRPILAPMRHSHRILSVLELGSADGYLTGTSPHSGTASLLWSLRQPWPRRPAGMLPPRGSSKVTSSV